MTELKKKKINRKISHVYNLEVNIAKMSLLPKTIYRFNDVPIKILMELFTETEKNNPKAYVELQKT